MPLWTKNMLEVIKGHLNFKIFVYRWQHPSSDNFRLNEYQQMTIHEKFIGSVKSSFPLSIIANRPKNISVNAILNRTHILREDF